MTMKFLNHDLGPDLDALREAAADFARREIAPIAESTDADNVFPRQLWPKLGELGALGMTAGEDVGGMGMGYSQHAGMVIVCDGTPEAAARIERVLWNDPATGVMRHADAGYEDAIACAEEQNLDLPMIGR